MKHLLVILALFACFVIASTTPVWAQHDSAHHDAAPHPEEEAIRAAVGHYLQGHATGDSAHHEKVFHPESKLFWVRDGQLNQRTSAAYIAGAPGSPADDEAQRQRHIAMIDVTGNTAVVKVVLDYPSALITDYFSMLKVDGSWKIINKIFHVEPKSDS